MILSELRQISRFRPLIGVFEGLKKNLFHFPPNDGLNLPSTTLSAPFLSRNAPYKVFWPHTAAGLALAVHLVTVPGG